MTVLAPRKIVAMTLMAWRIFPPPVLIKDEHGHRTMPYLKVFPRGSQP